ncbi:T9SS C-terminal target domain-containing protein [candidate division KSB1 bacterium]|nr:T9SS type A sorting domain-containing protein [candidate division KSB1 bacterium]RQW01330.1 MAG: T9SS C-terminal target domain-containing protein [candidate division KSB1 bacterium]
MKTIYLLLMIIAFVVLYCGNGQASDEADPAGNQAILHDQDRSAAGSGMIRGEIKWMRDGTPVAGAMVEVHYPPDGRGPRKTFVADSEGRYQVDGLEEGTYHVTLSGAVQQGGKILFMFLGDGQFFLHITNNQTTDINFQVKPGGSISGKVTQESTGQSIENAIIRLYHTNWDENFHRRVATDSSGNYFIGGLNENDQVYIYASGEIGQQVELSHQFASWDTLLAGEYYPESPSRSSAHKIKIMGQQQGVDFTLSGTGIVGFVRKAANNDPVLCTHVMLYNENWDILTYANIDSFHSGFYCFKNLQPGGTYYLEATGWNWISNQQDFLPAFYDGAAARADASLLILADELKEIDFYLAEGIQIKGKITRQEGGEPIGFARVALYDANWNYKQETSTNSEGNYSLLACAGDYYVEATGWGDFDGEYQKLYQNEFYNESPNQDGAMLLHVMADINDINFTLQELVRITGKVIRKSDGAAIQESQVITYDQDWTFVQETRSNSNGVFYFTDLDSAKSYYFEASGKVWWDFGSFGDWNLLYKPQYFDKAATRDSATLVTISGTMPQIDFILDDFAGFTISGKVMLENDGSPLASCEINIYDVNRQEVQMLLSSDMGEYTTQKLAKGFYYAVASGFCVRENWRKLYRAEYYPEATNWENATLLPLDQELTEINFTLVEGTSVCGNISKQYTREPIAEAQISVYDEQWNYLSERRSDHSGFYQVFDLEPGDYYIKATGKIYMDVGGYGEFVPFYHPAFYDGAYREQEATLVYIDKNVDGIDLTLSDINSYRISGEVTLAKDAKSVAKTQILLLDDKWQCVTSCLSFANGHYGLQGIDAGKYYVKASGYCLENDSLVQHFQPLYYPGTTDSSQANPLIVTAIMEHIDFTLNVTQIDEKNEKIQPIPSQFFLAQNYPNPFNHATVIKFDVPEECLVILQVFNISGTQVARLVQEVKSPGSYKVAFEPTHFSSGVYLYRLQTPRYTSTKKMALIK